MWAHVSSSSESITTLSAIVFSVVRVRSYVYLLLQQRLDSSDSVARTAGGEATKSLT